MVVDTGHRGNVMRTGTRCALPIVSPAAGGTHATRRALCLVRLGGAAPNPPGYLENRDDVYAAQFLSEEACAAIHFSYDCDTVQAGTPMTVNGDEPLPSRRGLFCFL